VIHVIDLLGRSAYNKIRLPEGCYHGRFGKCQWESLVTTAAATSWTPADHALWQSGVQPVHCTRNESGSWTPQTGTTGAAAPFAPFGRPPGPVRPALRVPAHAVMFDVDCDRDGKTGDQTIIRMQERLGPLPPTFKLTARGAAQNSGRYGYRIPTDLVITDAAFGAFGGNVEIIRTGHRFSWAPGDIHPATRTPVVCYGPDRQPVPMPPVFLWPELPAAWVDYLRSVAGPAYGATGPVRAPVPMGVEQARGAIERLGRELWDDMPQSGTFRTTIGTWSKMHATYMMALGWNADSAIERLAEMLATHPHWHDPGCDQDVAVATIVDYVRRYAETEPIELRADPDYVAAGYTAADQIRMLDTGAPPPPDMFENWGRGPAAEPARQPGMFDAVGPGRQIRLTPLSEIKSSRREWLWAPEPATSWGVDRVGYEKRIPAASVTLCAGKGGVGKSTFILWIAAQITRGTLPGMYFGRPQNAVIYATEDDFESTIKPRFIALNGDTSRLFRVAAHEGDMVGLVDLGTELAHIEQRIADVHAVVFLVDPIIGAVKGNAHYAQDVRRGIEPIQTMAVRQKCAVLGLHHLAKNTKDGLSAALSASHAFRDVARALLVFAKDDDSGEHVMTLEKSNYGPDDYPDLAYQMPVVSVALDDGNHDDFASFELVGEANVSAADALASNTRGEQAMKPIEELDWLAELLRHDPVQASEVEAVWQKSRDTATPVDARDWGSIRNQVSRSKLFHSEKERVFKGKYFWSLTDAGRRAYRIDATTLASQPPFSASMKHDEVSFDQQFRSVNLDVHHGVKQGSAQNGHIFRGDQVVPQNGPDFYSPSFTPPA
jgi:hypothetical protein